MNELSRRRFLKCAGLAAAGVAAGGASFDYASRMAEAAYPAAPGAGPKSKPDTIVFEGKYPGWPWIAAGADGTLYCAFREGTEHGFSAAGRALLAISRDRGRTWPKPLVIVDEPGVDDRNVAIAELPGRELLVTYNSFTEAGESQALATLSADGGRTWSAPRPLDEPNTRTRAAAVVLSGGRLLLPYYVAPGNGALAAVSDDNGRSWKTRRVPDTEGFIGDEWDVLEVERGRLIGLIRNSHPKTDGIFWKTESADGGKSWSIPAPTNVQSRRYPSPPQLVKHEGTPVLIYADRRMVSVSAVRTTDPDYLQWDVEGRVPCYVYNADESPIPDGSYPVSAPVGRRQRLIVDYEIRPDSRRIAGYFVEFPQDWQGTG